MRLRVESRLADSLCAHLAEQGFPAVRVEAETLDVLFPGASCIFAAAAELDLWTARLDERTAGVVIEDAQAGRPAARAPRSSGTDRAGSLGALTPAGGT